jgi:tetrahydromethanopterin S-methyltransferase subunit E
MAGDERSGDSPGEGSGTYPHSTPRRRAVDWAGAGLVLAGGVAASVAFIVLDELWLWVLAGVLLVAGVVVMAVARPSAASARGRVRSPDQP